MSWGLFGLAGVAAIADWFAVVRADKSTEYVFKPLTILFLIGFVVAQSDAPERVRIAILAALVFSLAGDIFLMIPRDLFVPGLASFLFAHLCYLVAFSPLPPIAETWPIVAVVAIVSGTLLSIVVGSMQRKNQKALIPPVVAYVAAIAAMVTAALATLVGDSTVATPAFAAVGALLFYVSDALIGWDRFVTALTWAPVAIIVTYHLGQAGLVLSLTG